MKNDSKPDLRNIVSQFSIEGEFLEAQPYGTGHINDTYFSRIRTADGDRRFVHQRINSDIFKKPQDVMENIERVTVHLRKKIISSGGDPLRQTLNIVPTTDGKSFHVTDNGKYWRTYLFIEDAKTYDVVENLNDVYSASKAFGEFQKLVSDLPGERLHETIVGFHDTRHRFKTFRETLESDALNRAASVRKEIDFVLAREKDVSVLVDLIDQGKTPERIAHNDTKLNNVMIDDETGQGLCVIDLDTVMPGLPMYDFGDSVRIAANPAAEDQRDLSKVTMDIKMFDCIARGYLEEALEFLTPVEIAHLAFSAKLMTFECGMRFLGDHIAGDVYFKVHRDRHNLDRARTQFKMVQDMETQADQMEAIIAKYSANNDKR